MQPGAALDRLLAMQRMQFSLMALALAGACLSAQDFTGAWTVSMNGYRAEMYLKQEGNRVRGWLGVAGQNVDGDVLSGTVQGAEINMTRSSRLLPRPQEWRGFLLIANNTAIDARQRATGTDSLAGIGSHNGTWSFGWWATRAGAYREPPGPATTTTTQVSGASLVGTWNWVSGQTLVIKADGTCDVLEGARKINECRWESVGGGQYRLTHRSGGWVDTVSVSADGRALDGRNNQGAALHGTRREATLAGRWSWVSGQTLVVNANNTCDVFEGSRKINECAVESLGGNRYRLTHRSGGWVDTVTLSDDGRTIDGRNNLGASLRGTRQ